MSGGLDGLVLREGVAWDPPEVMVTPSGRSVVPGSVDDLGYVLPVDIPRARPVRPDGLRPSLSELRARRAALGASPFPEFRLGVDEGHTQNETSIDVWGSVLVGGWNEFTDSGLSMGWARSEDGGMTWNWSRFEDGGGMSDPVVRAGDASRWYYNYIASGNGGSDYEVYVRHSVDAGLSWSQAVAVTQNTSFDDKNMMDARGDQVLVAWANIQGLPVIHAARSLDGGLSFQHETALSINAVNGQGAMPLILADDTYVVFWRDSFQESIWMARSVDQGQSWSADVAIVAMNPLPNSVPGGFRVVNLPIADSDPNTGHMVVVWHDQVFGNPDVVCIRSADGGDTWSEPVRVNDDVGTAHQYYPWVAIDDAGTVHVVWYDRRHGASDLDVYYSFSQDGGATFSKNVRITGQSFTPVLPWEGSAAQFIGDYIGIAARDGVAYPFYQDARSGVQDVYVSLVEVETQLSYEEMLALWPNGVTILDLLTASQ